MTSKFTRTASFFVVGVQDFIFSKELQIFLKEYPVAGLALFNSPYDNPLNIWSDPESALEAVYEFSVKARAAGVPFLAVDQEGGRVRRLRKPFVDLPPAQKIADAFENRSITAADITQLYRLAAKQMADSQIALNFAPVCDLRYPQSSKVIGDRSYGSDPKSVIALATLFLDAFSQESVYTTLKHCPGHGPSEFDSHEKIAQLFKERHEILNQDFKIFTELAPKASAIMTAHVAYPEMPDRILSLDLELLNELRARIPRANAWITDDLLQMKAVCERDPWIDALDCNYDLILVCGTLHQAARALDASIRHIENKVSDFKSEQIWEKRIERSLSLFGAPERPALPSFGVWRESIIRCENESMSILEKIHERS